MDAKEWEEKLSSKETWKKVVNSWFRAGSRAQKSLDKWNRATLRGVTSNAVLRQSSYDTYTYYVVAYSIHPGGISRETVELLVNRIEELKGQLMLAKHASPNPEQNLLGIIRYDAAGNCNGLYEYFDLGGDEYHLQDLSKDMDGIYIDVIATDQSRFWPYTAFALIDGVLYRAHLTQ